MTAAQNGTGRTLRALPATWEQRADKLERLMRAHARARSAHTRAHARAYLDATGPAPEREQAARLAAADLAEQADYARAELDAYRLLLDAAREESLP